MMGLLKPDKMIWGGGVNKLSACIMLQFESMVGPYRIRDGGEISPPYSPPPDCATVCGVITAHDTHVAVARPSIKKMNFDSIVAWWTRRKIILFHKKQHFHGYIFLWTALSNHFIFCCLLTATDNWAVFLGTRYSALRCATMLVQCLVIGVCDEIAATGA